MFIINQVVVIHVPLKTLLELEQDKFSISTQIQNSLNFMYLKLGWIRLVISCMHIAFGHKELFYPNI